MGSIIEAFPGKSCGNAALLAWLNPLYSPPGPPACMAPERQLKSA